ncbi:MULTISPECIES: LysR family transcriptional regulator [unclassified Mesorhizobium]|uniref:helix-turn-helix domain-containing protein n=1 Tax=unclassified Mesorhizobium TaxID=325217 RepID=UPI00333543F3
MHICRLVRPALLRAASRKSGRAEATLSRRVIGLEESLGVGLFERGDQAAIQGRSETVSGRWLGRVEFR